MSELSALVQAAMLACAVLYLAASSAAGDRLAAWVHDRDADDPSPVEEVHAAYLDGEIDEQELERRLGILVDDRATTIRDMCDDVDGIGDELSRDLADEFDSVADLHAADADDLQRVDGIGETKAERLRKRL